MDTRKGCAVGILSGCTGTNSYRSECQPHALNAVTQFRRICAGGEDSTTRHLESIPMQTCQVVGFTSTDRWTSLEGFFPGQKRAHTKNYLSASLVLGKSLRLRKAIRRWQIQIHPDAQQVDSQHQVAHRAWFVHNSQNGCWRTLGAKGHGTRIASPVSITAYPETTNRAADPALFVPYNLWSSAI